MRALDELGKIIDVVVFLSQYASETMNEKD
jgi:NTP pyrophosphatase (non-canonical NTP hydrolase)